MNILVSSAGRRGALVRLIRDTLQPLGGQVFAMDAAPWSSACRLADGWSLVPRFDDPSFFDTVLQICRRYDIRLIIPTHDRELPLYAQMKPLFAALDIHVACSGPETVAIASDKRHTDRFLRTHQLPCVERIDLSRARALDTNLPYPLIIKPSRGSGSDGVHLATDAEELAFYLKRTVDPIVQRQAKGREFTTNCFINDQGECVAAVPHWRIETRGGEVSKCVTERQPELIKLAQQLAECLPDAFGPLCFQAFVDDQGMPRLIELNARFGGGYPIAHRAGVNFVQWLIDGVRGEPLQRASWTDGLAMTRWDDAVFWETEKVARCAA